MRNKMEISGPGDSWEKQNVFQDNQGNKMGIIVS